MHTGSPLALEGDVEMGGGASKSGSDATSELQQLCNLGCVREPPRHQGHKINSASLACGQTECDNKSKSMNILRSVV